MDKAVGLISEDYQKFTFSSGGQQPSNNAVHGIMAGLGPIQPRDHTVFPVRDVSGGVGSAHHHRNGSSLPPPVVAPPPQLQQQDMRLPEDVAYVLRTTLTEGGVQFLSLQQIDTVIDYYSRERERMTSSQTASRQQPSLPSVSAQPVPSGYASNYAGSSSSMYGNSIGHQNSSGNNSASLHMDKVPDVLKLVQESDVLQKLLAGVSSQAANHDQTNHHSVHHNQGPYNQNLGNHSMNSSGLNASRRGPHEMSRVGSGIGGADRGYGGRF